MNKVFLIGRLTKDPELRFTAGTGIGVANFTLAVDRNFTGQDGQKQADFIPVICWRKLAEHVANNLTKGRLVAVSGLIRTGSYQTQDGKKRYKTEVVANEVKFLDWAKDNAGIGTANYNQADADAGFYPVEGEEDIPF